MNTLLDRLQPFLDNLWQHLPDAILTAVIGWIFIEIVVAITKRLLRASRMKPGLQRVIRGMLRVFMIFVLFVAVIQALGLSNVLVALTGSSVILAVLVSTGFTPLVSDILAGLSLGQDRQFQPGARVRAGDKGAEGEIVSLDIRKTYLRSEDGYIHVIPNSIIDKNEWIILKEPPSTRKRRSVRIKPKR